MSEITDADIDVLRPIAHDHGFTIARYTHTYASIGSWDQDDTLSLILTPLDAHVHQPFALAQAIRAHLNCWSYDLSIPEGAGFLSLNFRW